MQTESGRVSLDWLDWSLVELSVTTVVLLLEKGSDTMRLMRPAKCWSRLTFPPQGWRDKASAVSVEIQITETDNLLRQHNDFLDSLTLSTVFGYMY